MTTFIYYTKNNNGGKDYIEIDHQNQVFITGNTAAHVGFMDEHGVMIELKTKKALKELIIHLDNVLRYPDVTARHYERTTLARYKG